MDIAGNVYATDNGNNQAKEIKRVGGYYVNPVFTCWFGNQREYRRDQRHTNHGQPG